jgi:hypothetical protein
MWRESRARLRVNCLQPDFAGAPLIHKEARMSTKLYVSNLPLSATAEESPR